MNRSEQNEIQPTSLSFNWYILVGCFVVAISSYVNAYDAYKAGGQSSIEAFSMLVQGVAWTGFGFPLASRKPIEGWRRVFAIIFSTVIILLILIPRVFHNA